MKKILSLFIFVYIFLYLVIPQAQAATLQGFISDCLDGEKTSNNYTGKLVFPPYEKSKIAPKDDTKTWIYACLSTDKGQICTSGDREVDIELFGTSSAYDYLTTLLIPPPTPTPNKLGNTPPTVGGVQERIDPNYVKGANPKKTTLFIVHPGFKELTNIETVMENAGYGKDTYWYDAYPVEGGMTHTWYWLQAIQPITNNDVVGNQTSQKLGTIKFDQLKSNLQCSKVHWDPMGYVFDAQTLYPVKEISVLLSQQQKDKSFITVPTDLGITNPYISLNTNGQYTFLVPPGFYKMRVDSPNVSLASISSLNPLYEEVFGNDIYTFDMIVEEVKGKIAVSHLPIIVGDKSLLIKELRLLDHLEEGLSSGNLSITGRLSHPKSNVYLRLSYLDKNGRAIIKNSSDKDVPIITKIGGRDTQNQLITDSLGTYNFVIPQMNEMMYLKEVNITYSLNKTIYKDGLESTIEPITVKPIPSYIEGVAYDELNIAIPNAIVGLYPTFSEKPMYLTITDELGRFKIGSQYIPRFQYNLRYKKTTGEVIQIDTKTFITQNIKLFSKERISPFTNINSTSTEDIKVQEYFANNDKLVEMKIKKNTIIPSSSQSQISSSNEEKQSQKIMAIIIIITLCVFTGAGFIILVKSKKNISKN